MTEKVKNFSFIIFLIGFCFANESLVSNYNYKKALIQRSKEVFVQIGHIDDFVLDHGHPFKKKSVFGYTIIQHGKLKEFILDSGYPSKINPGQIISNFKIIGQF